MRPRSSAWPTAAFMPLVVSRATGSCSRRQSAPPSPKSSHPEAPPSTSPRIVWSASPTALSSPRRSSSRGWTRLGRPRLEGEAVARELLDLEAALDRRLDVELLADVGVLADELASLARNGLPRRRLRLPEIHCAPALGRLVRNPGLEPKPLDLLQRTPRFVSEVGAQRREGGVR